jgi:hypothetical protein
MQKKIKKSAADALIDNVLEDLKQSTEEPSISFVSTKDGKSTSSNSTSVLGKSLLSPAGDEKTSLSGPPEGLIVKAAVKKEVESTSPSDKTQVFAPKAKIEVEVPVKKLEPTPQVSYGSNKPMGRGTPYDSNLIQAENLKLAQNRITELEKLYEEMRKEADVLQSAQEVIHGKLEEYQAKVQTLERTKQAIVDQHESEIRVYREGLNIKDGELSRLKIKNEELEGRLAQDLRKVRVRERELENRLELAKLEKNALVRSKDETILELKRKIEHLNIELENYKAKILELNAKVESNQDQFGRTVRALRLALTNLEVNESTGSITIAPIKKAE